MPDVKLNLMVSKVSLMLKEQIQREVLSQLVTSGWVLAASPDKAGLSLGVVDQNCGARWGLVLATSMRRDFLVGGHSWGG